MKKKLPKDYEERIDFMYQVVQKKHDYLNESFNALGNKINYLFAITGALLIAYITLIFQYKLLECLLGYQYVIRVSAILTLGVSLICLLISSKTRKFKNPPKMESIYSEDAFLKDYQFLKKQIITSIVKGYEDNLKLHNEVVRWVKCSHWLLFSSICLIIMGVLLK